MEEKESDCLHCDINDVVRDHIEQNTPVNLPEVVGKVGESLVDLILLGPKEEWASLLAEAVSYIGQVFLEKSGAADDTTVHYHLAMAYQKTNQTSQARQQLERALKINPNNADARKALSELRG